MPKKRGGLGRGIEALIMETDGHSDASSVDEKSVIELKISEIEPNSKQPRHTFDVEKLQSLSESIKQYGVIQPIIVQQNPNGFYRIVAGERRWRAAKMAGLTTVPALVKTLEELKSVEIALIENLQREDLNPIEEALGYKNLMDRFSLTQEQISTRVGKSRSAVANSLRLLSLDDEILELVKQKELSEGHARALLGLSDREKRLFVASKIVEEDLSVRQTEALVKKYNQEDAQQTPAKKPSQVDYILADMKEKLQASLKTKVKIVSGAKKGKIEIEYYGNDDLQRIAELIERI